MNKVLIGQYLNTRGGGNVRGDEEISEIGIY